MNCQIPAALCLSLSGEDVCAFSTLQIAVSTDPKHHQRFTISSYSTCVLFDSVVFCINSSERFVCSSFYFTAYLTVFTFLSYLAFIFAPAANCSYLRIHLLCSASTILLPTSIMPNRCVVGGCSTTCNTFPFPEDRQRRQLWVRYVTNTRSDFSSTSHKAPVMCLKHFSREMFQNYSIWEAGVSKW